MKSPAVVDVTSVISYAKLLLGMFDSALQFAYKPSSLQLYPADLVYFYQNVFFE